MERKLFSPFCETLMFMTLACQKEKIEYIVGRVWYYIRIIQKQEVCIVLSLYYLSPRARALSLSLVQSETIALYTSKNNVSAVLLRAQSSTIPFISSKWQWASSKCFFHANTFSSRHPNPFHQFEFHIEQILYPVQDETVVSLHS
jgi:hypothetical protein